MFCLLNESLFAERSDVHICNNYVIYTSYVQLYYIHSSHTVQWHIYNSPTHHMHYTLLYSVYQHNYTVCINVHKYGPMTDLLTHTQCTGITYIHVYIIYM